MTTSTPSRTLIVQGTSRVGSPSRPAGAADPGRSEPALPPSSALRPLVTALALRALVPVVVLTFDRDEWSKVCGSRVITRKM